MNSPREVDVCKIFVVNSICGFRESKKSDKYVVELATRAQDPEIRALTVKVLNEHHKEVRSAQDDPQNGKLMKQLLQEKLLMEKELNREEEEATAGAKTVPETALVVDPSNIVDGKRTRKESIRYQNIQ